MANFGTTKLYQISPWYVRTEAIFFRCRGDYKVPRGLNRPMSESIDDHDRGHVGGQVVCLYALFFVFPKCNIPACPSTQYQQQPSGSHYGIIATIHDPSGNVFECCSAPHNVQAVNAVLHSTDRFCE